MEILKKYWYLFLFGLYFLFSYKKTIRKKKTKIENRQWCKRSNYYHKLISQGYSEEVAWSISKKRYPYNH